MGRSHESIDLSKEHRVYGKGRSVASEIQRIQDCGGWVEDGRVCGVLAVSRAFGDPDFKGEGLKSLLQKGVVDGYWTQEFADAQQFVGDPITSVPDVLEISVTKDTDEFIIVASDGLWDVISTEEGCKFTRNDLLKGKHPTQAAERLVEIACRRRTSDNVAVVVIDLKGSEYWSNESGKKTKKVFGLF